MGLVGLVAVILPMGDQHQLGTREGIDGLDPASIDHQDLAEFLEVHLLVALLARHGQATQEQSDDADDRSGDQVARPGRSAGRGGLNWRGRLNGGGLPRLVLALHRMALRCKKPTSVILKWTSRPRVKTVQEM